MDRLKAAEIGKKIVGPGGTLKALADERKKRRRAKRLADKSLKTVEQVQAELRTR
jgi:hypothetical protein